MIHVKCLASGSTGNSYAIDDGKSALLLEAGIPVKKMQEGYLKLWPRIAGCLVTHEHMDHADSAGRLADLGIDLYSADATFEEIKGCIRRPYRRHVVRVGEKFELGSWIVLPWQAQHDAADPLGYLIYSTVTHERLLFATDTYYIPNTFSNLNYIMVECNYSIELLEENILHGSFPESHKIRVMQSHFSVENVKAFLMHNDLSMTQHIYLIHVSSQNGDKALFKKQIQKLTGLPVTVF